MSVSEIQIFDASTNLNNAIFVRSRISFRTFISVLNLNATRIYGRGVLSFIPSLSAIYSVVVSNRLNLRIILIKFSCGYVFIMKNFNRCAFRRIGSLRNTNSLDNVALRLQNIESFLKLGWSNPKFFFNACADIQRTLSFEFFLKTFSGFNRLA